MRSADRPLSPHLQIYRWQLTSVLSILHRATGVALGCRRDPAGVVAGRRRGGAGGLWRGRRLLGSWLGLVLLFGWSAALFYHLCNGIRHLVWDTGHALDLKSTYAGGWIVVAATAIADRDRLGRRHLALGRLRWRRRGCARRSAARSASARPRKGSSIGGPQRVTAIALVPLVLWFVIAVIGLAGADLDAVQSIGSADPLPAICLVLLLIATFYHAALGLQVVIEDYVHERALRLGPGDRLAARL